MQDTHSPSAGLFGNMDDNKWMALSGFGQALGALGQGRTPDMSPTMALIARNKEHEAQKKALSESGVLSSMPPEMRAVVASMPPGLGARTVMQHLQQQEAIQAQQNDPMRQLQMQNLQSQIDARNAPAPQRRETAQDINGRLRYLDTGEFAFPDAMPGPENPSAKDAQIARLVEQGIDQNTATLIADGVCW